MQRRSPRIAAADPRKVVGYVRVSTEDQALGPVAQRAALARWCVANGAELVAVFEDIGGGALPLDKRPGLLDAIDALEEHGAGVLLTAKRDRLARDVMNAGMIERLAERVGARTRSAAGEGTEGDAADPAAMMLRGIMDVFAQYERAVIRARTKAALAVKKGRGERVGSIPYGCQLAADGRSLEANPAELRAVELVRELRGEGLTLRAIAARLEAAGYAPRGGAKWHPDTVARIAAVAA